MILIPQYIAIDREHYEWTKQVDPLIDTVFEIDVANKAQYHELIVDSQDATSGTFNVEVKYVGDVDYTPVDTSVIITAANTIFNGNFSGLISYVKITATSNPNSDYYITLRGLEDDPVITVSVIGSLFAGATAKTTPVDADGFGYSDSADGGKIKLLTVAAMKTWLKSIFMPYAMTGTWAQLVAAHAATPFADGTNLLCSSGLGFVVRPVGGLLMVSTPQIGRQSISSSSGVVTIDLHSGYYSNELTLTENVTSWSFTNLPSTDEVIEKLVPIVQHASAAKTVVSPATSGKTAGGIPWVADTTLSSREVLLLRVDSSGTVTLFPTGKQV